MSPDGGGEPDGKLARAIRETFRTIDLFRETMEAAAMSTFGSGWAWLVHDGTRVLIVTTTNQDCPISDGLTPCSASTCGSTRTTSTTRTVARTTSRRGLKS